MSDGLEYGKKLFSELLGEKTRNVKLGHGSFITIDFGKDVEHKGIIKGEWRLWIIFATWRLEKNHESIVTSNDDRNEIKTKIAILENKQLLKATILNNVFDLMLEFESDLQLLTTSSGKSDYDKQWMLFTPKNEIFRAGPETSWNLEYSKP